MTILQSAILAVLYGAPIRNPDMIPCLERWALAWDVRDHFPGFAWSEREAADIRRVLATCIISSGGEA